MYLFGIGSLSRAHSTVAIVVVSLFPIALERSSCCCCWRCLLHTCTTCKMQVFMHTHTRTQNRIPFGSYKTTFCKHFIGPYCGWSRPWLVAWLAMEKAFSAVRGGEVEMVAPFEWVVGRWCPFHLSGGLCALPFKSVKCRVLHSLTLLAFSVRCCLVSFMADAIEKHLPGIKWK